MTAADLTTELTSVADARAALLGMVEPTATESMAVQEAVSRYLASPVRAVRALPPTDVSSMDGYAMRVADAIEGSVLPVAGDARAGQPISEQIAGTMTPITTGGPIPRGADAVVPIEDVSVTRDGVRLNHAPSVGVFIRRRGQDVAEGKLVVGTGRQIRALELAAVIAAGSHTVVVRRQPRVTILCGGDEVVPVGTQPHPHQVINSNGPMLESLVRGAGGTAQAADLLPDTAEGTSAALLTAAADADLVVVSGGVSVGDRDHVRGALSTVGEVVVWRVALRPGKPLLIGRIGRVPVVGLPGNPVSSAVTFELFVRPALIALQGGESPIPNSVGVRVGVAMTAATTLETYYRVTLTPGDDGIPIANLSGGQDSGMVTALAASDAMVVLQPGTHYERGDLVPALLLR